MSLRQIGPVALDETGWGDPKAAWTSAPDAAGVRGMSIDGVLPWWTATQLLELVDNPGRAVTVGDQSGVLEHLVFDDELLRPFTGWCLLQSCDVSGEQRWSLNGADGPVPFSLKAAYLGADREAVVVRTGRARSNDFGLLAVTLAAEPFGSASSTAADEAAVSTDPVATVPIGSRTAVRDYDRRAYALGADSASSVKTLYLQNLGSAQDRTTIVLAPRLNEADVPAWARYRGGDVRAYDRSEDREVFGPSHPFLATTDLAVTNGLIRFWVGSRGVAPYLSVAAWRSGSWREMGAVILDVASSPGAQLRGARLVRCTPDMATVALAVGGIGDIFVTLRRGERMLRVSHGATRTPSVSANRRAAWSGGPPGAFAVVSSGTGRFGKGWSLGASGSIVFDWPRVVPVERWSVVGRWVPDAASTAHADAGVAIVADAAGVPIAALSFDADTDSMVMVMGSNDLAIPVAFSSGQTVGWAMRFSVDEGMALSVNVADGTVTHASDPAAVDPNTTQASPTSLALLGPVVVIGPPPPPPGGLYPATDLYPSTTLYPEG